MKSFYRLVVPAGLLLAAAPAFAQEEPPVEEDRICANEIIGAETITTNLVIQAGGCILAGTVVEGDVLVEADATAFLVSADVAGSVIADGADRVMSRGSLIGGDLILTGLVGPRRSEIFETAVTGLIDVTGNAAEVRVLRNTVGLDILVLDNTAVVGVARNEVGESLICQNNEPAPLGGNNTVGVSKEGQCANF